ncbi:MAG: DUF499 domain-containing protein [Desulfobacterales bacterium]|nr:DUF499 domain-containing protein [Desulfobacterales bacterium]
MKTLFELCIPRKSVFEETKQDVVLDLTDLVQDRIDPNIFFEENFVTDGMKVLIETAFKRFRGIGASGVIKLTQAMGGGKTHNMIALGLLARYPRYIEKLNHPDLQDFKNLENTGSEIKVVAFTGRESDAPLGIWGAIAKQLGREEIFSEYYNPLSAPGQSAWISLLKDEAALILLDELPPYLENAMSRKIANSDLSVVTRTALANLFVALNKKELSKVCLVISDLRATYEKGSEILQRSFKELENEVNRPALNIEPVGSASDEVYHILKKRLFKSLPPENEINEVAKAYKNAVTEAKQMGYTNMSSEQIFVGIKESFPFHPSIRDLYARFKENPGFQQTRGLIRLMRLIVAQLYKPHSFTGSGTEPAVRAEKTSLVNVYDFDLNDRDILTAITQVKPSLSNAISHDIAANGQAVAEIVDEMLNQNSMQELGRLLLISSLADVPNALLGLSLQETIGYLCEPYKDITQVKKSLDEFIMRAWYLYTDRDSRLFFKNTKNMIAELNTLVDSYDSAIAKKELRGFLEENFKPVLGDCYQKVQVFPGIDEILLSEDKTMLVLFEPYIQGGLHPELEAFYEDARCKNRVMFLSGRRNTMDNLVRIAKERKAIQVIISRMQEEKIAENNPQYAKAVDKFHKITLNLLQAARETFATLYYPGKKGLMKADFLMEFRDNHFNGEKQVKDILMQKQKFTEDITGDIFRKKCEDRLFTQKEMRWNDIKSRAAANPAWQWHLPRALDDLKYDMLKKGIWRESGGYVEKPPFPKEKTDVLIRELHRNTETGEVILMITPRYGDRVLYETGSAATPDSPPAEDLNKFRTSELKLSFLCIDTKGEHPAGEPKEWCNKIAIKYRVYDKEDDKVLELKSVPDIPIRYTVDGSNPKDYGVPYDGELKVPSDVTHVQAVAEEQDVYSEVLTVRIDRTKGATVGIDKDKALTLARRIKTNDTSETYGELNQVKKHSALLSQVFVTFYKNNENNGGKGWIELSFDGTTKVDPKKLEIEMDNIRSNFMNEGKIDISLEYTGICFRTGQNFLDWVAEKKLALNNFEEQEIIQVGSEGSGK